MRDGEVEAMSVCIRACAISSIRYNLLSGLCLEKSKLPGTKIRGR
jgi:hypothetical protein